MTERFEKSIRTLELPQVLELLAAQASSLAAQERARALRPETDLEEVRRLQAETSAARALLDVGRAPNFAGLRPVEAALQRASLGGSLNPRELLDIAGVLRCARQARASLGDAEEPTCLDGMFRSLVANAYLENKITGAILSEEEIADQASPALADVRRKIRAASGKAREVLQRLISSSSAKYLQEPIVTIRSGRFVVPVKAECRGSVPGLVHDVSASGSTFFVEPMAAVKANNELRELQAREEKEIERILAALSAEAAGFREDILLDCDLLVALDLIFARGRLSVQMEAIEPQLTADGSLRFLAARHPLLDRKKAVPIDLNLGITFDTLVITGPNTGGKTVTLKTAGLLCLMAQCGLHLPVADGSRCPVYREILADIGDEQSIEQSLSTFSAHITNIVGILSEAGEGSLILLDELGAGTDPIEGAALAVAIIEEARSLGAKVAATTHYAELKTYAMTEPGVENASCEFDVETLRPTYRLLIGVPGKSNAFAISRRLGLPEHIIRNAAGRIDRQNVQFEDVLARLERQRQEMERAKEEAERLRVQMESDASAAAAERRRLESARRQAAQEARREAEEIVREARAVSNRVFQELDEMKKQARREESAQEANERRSRLRHSLNEAEARLAPAREAPPPISRPAEVGDTVELLRVGTKARVAAVNKDGSLRLEAGAMTVTASQDEVRVVEGQGAKSPRPKPSSSAGRVDRPLRAAGAPSELDIRGLMTDECAGVIDRFLDDAVMARLQTVTIIHGKGTGALRQAVQQHLKTCKYVKRFRPGRFGEGENGVTVVELR
ncbi:MAG TPA: endonuclease MutS2 [Candidatus Onthomonas avicola]|nr:endonuclease MutS2 [Candidatus Onthomonas avicola]